MNAPVDSSSAMPRVVKLRLAPLDVPLELVCAEEAVAAMKLACHGWEGAPDAGGLPLRLRIDCSPALSGTGGVNIRADALRLALQGPGATGQADVGRGSASCAISADYLDDPAALRQEVLDPLVLMLLTRRDRTPVHASAFIADGLAFLLAGPTGTGKSCLARAADEAGFQVLSDDTVYVQLEPHMSVWGWPHAAHLLPGDAPDTAGPTRLRGGKIKHVVAFRSARRIALRCDRAVLCLLEPSQGPPALDPLAANSAEKLMWPLDEGFDLLPDLIAKAVRGLSARGAWRLRLSDDPAAAISLLASRLPQLEKAAARP